MHLTKFLNKQILLPAILLLFTCTVGGQKKNQVDPFFFIQLTDPQFGMYENNQGFEKETALVEKAVAGINELHPDFVVITGDFVHNQNSEDQINEFKRIVAKINSRIPVYYTPGNHDIGQNPDKQSLKKYRNNYGKDRFVFKHKGSAFIGFNTSFLKAPMPGFEQKQYSWLAKRVGKSKKADHIMLFCHYPFFNQSVDEPEAYSNIGPESRKKYLSLFESNGVTAVFSGHHHNNTLNSYGKVQLVTTSALGKPLGKAPSGMRIVKIYNNKIEHEYFDLDELPDSVVFHQNIICSNSHCIYPAFRPGCLRQINPFYRNGSE